VNIEEFGQFKNGTLVPITVRERQVWAFVPKMLPCEWKLPERLWPLLVTAREAIAELNAIAGSLPNPLFLNTSLRRREAIKSSTIEDTHVSPDELLRFEMESAEERTAGVGSANALEVLNCADALRAGREYLRNHELGLDLIRDLHRTLLSGTRMAHKNPGQFRQVQVFVGRRFTPSPPGIALSDCLENFERYLVSPGDSLDALVRAFVAHYQFEAIHPFEDGNGRIGRILLSLMICRDLSLHEPWIGLSGYFERHRREYYDRLLAVSTHGEWDEWVEFCLHGAVREAGAATDKCEKLRQLRDTYHDKMGNVTPRAAQVIEHLFLFPVVEASALARTLRVSYNTARSDIDNFVKFGILRKAGRGRPQAYRADEIMDISYPPDD